MGPPRHARPGRRSRAGPWRRWTDAKFNDGPMQGGFFVACLMQSLTLEAVIAESLRMKSYPRTGWNPVANLVSKTLRWLILITSMSLYYVSSGNIRQNLYNTSRKPGFRGEPLVVPSFADTVGNSQKLWELIDFADTVWNRGNSMVASFADTVWNRRK